MQTQIELEDKLYTSTQVADILGVSLRTLYRYMEDNRIQSMRTGSGRHRFTKDQILEFLNAGEISQQQAPSQPAHGNTMGSQPVGYSQPQQNTNIPNQSNVMPSDTFGQQQANVNPQAEQSQQNVGFGQQASQYGQGLDSQRSQTTQQYQADNVNQPSQWADMGQQAPSQPAPDTVGEVQSYSDPVTPVNQETNNESQSQPQSDNLNAESGSNLQSYLEQQNDLSANETQSDFGTPKAQSSSDQFGTPADLTYNQTQNVPAQNSEQNEPGFAEAQVNNSGASPVNANPMASTVGAVTATGFSPVSNNTVPQAQPATESRETVDLSNNMNIRYYKSDYSDLIELAKKIKDTAISRDLEYGFTLYAGVSLHFLIKPFTILHFYGNPEDVQLWKDELRLTPAQTKEDSNVGMVINTDIVFVPTREIGGFKVVDDKVLLRDISNIGEDELVAKFRQQLTSV